MQAVENEIKTVGIITPYSEQAKCIQQLIQASSLDAKQVQSSTVPVSGSRTRFNYF